MKKNDLSVFELEKDGFKLKLQKGAQGQPILTAPIALAPGIGAAPASAIGSAPSESSSSGAESSASALKDITSPMVGTFYRSPSPESSSFVDVGSTVNE